MVFIDIAKLEDSLTSRCIVETLLFALRGNRPTCLLDARQKRSHLQGREGGDNQDTRDTTSLRRQNGGGGTQEAQLYLLLPCM